MEAASVTYEIPYLGYRCHRGLVSHRHRVCVRKFLDHCEISPGISVLLWRRSLKVRVIQRIQFNSVDSLPWQSNTMHVYHGHGPKFMAW